MLSELREELNELKEYYDAGIMLSMKESIEGSSLCGEILARLDAIEQGNDSDENKISQLYDYIDKKMESIKTLESYEPLMSASGYGSSVLSEIMKIIKTHSVNKTNFKWYYFNGKIANKDCF